MFEFIYLLIILLYFKNNYIGVVITPTIYFYMRSQFFLTFFSYRKNLKFCYAIKNKKVHFQTCSKYVGISMQYFLEIPPITISKP